MWVGIVQSAEGLSRAKTDPSTQEGTGQHAAFGEPSPQLGVRPQVLLKTGPGALQPQEPIPEARLPLCAHPVGSAGPSSRHCPLARVPDLGPLRNGRPQPLAARLVSIAEDKGVIVFKMEIL